MKWPCNTFQDELCDGFISLSRWTYRTLRFSFKNNYSIREETITEMLLMKLLKKFPHRIQIEKFTAQNESTIGADWDWRFIGHSKIFQMRIQAKKLYDNGKYGALKDSNQTNKLISSATKSNPKRFPAYCFYNYWRGNPNIGGAYCGKMTPGEVIKGCTLAGAKSVQKLLKNKKNNLNDIAKISIPMLCLVCCDNSKAPKIKINDNWLPENVRRICVKLAGNNKEVPDLVNIDEDFIPYQYSVDAKKIMDENLAGVVTVYQENITENING